MSSFFHLLFAVDNPPSFTCPSPISGPNVAGEAYANISWPEITLTDDYTPTGSLQVTGYIDITYIIEIICSSKVPFPKEV